jgi:hypothetical protein
MVVDSKFLGKMSVFRNAFLLTLAYFRVRAHRRRKGRVQAAGALFLALLFFSSAAYAACEPGPGQVSFYKDAGFKGSCVVKGVGNYPNANTIGLPNDSISSVRVGANAQTVVCKDNDFKGDCILLSSDVNFLNNNRVGNDQVSSVRVQPLGFNQCVPAANQVSFFTNADFLGECVVKNIGNYASSGAIGLPNDSISSIRVGADAQTVVCRDNDFKGDCILLTSDVRFLNNDRVGNDQVSSAKVQARGFTACQPGSNQVSFFTNADFLGDCVIKNIGDYASSGAIGLPNDSISSVRLGDKVQAVVCKDDDFKGDCILLRSSVNYLSGNRVGNDEVSSAKVQPAGATECEPGDNQASFFLHADFLAPCVVKAMGNYPNAGAIGLGDKQISGIKIGPGAQVCAYDQTDFSGPVQTYTSSTAYLGSNNDKISSVRVQAAGTDCAQAIQPFISAGIEPFPDGSGFKLLRIRGGAFQPGEIVKLQITIKQGNNNPGVVLQATPSDSSGNIDYKYTGSGGGVCSLGETTTFQVQGFGQTSGKTSNIAVAGC